MKMNLKKIILPLVASAALLITSSAACAETNKNKDNHVVFYVPHQDDEALSFGVGIMNHLKAGFEVHVVLLTDGSASGVRKKMGMTEEEFSQARDNEFALSMKSMGVKSSNVEYMNFKDGDLSVKQVENVIKSYEKKYPKARHKTFSYTDPHHDHSNAGIALKNVQNTKITDDARYYLKRGYYPSGVKLHKELYDNKFTPKMRAVSRAYTVENESLGLYGIGRKSVGQSFKEFDKLPVSVYHK